MFTNKDKNILVFQILESISYLEKHPMTALKSTPWLLKVMNKSTLIFLFTKQKNYLILS